MRKIRFTNSETDDRLGPLALDLCSRATINQLRDDAAELSALYDVLSEPERARLLVLLFGDG